jgi:hypothetical protein
MSKYGDYLAANGATADEVKILDTPVAARLYDKQVAEAEEARAAAAKLEDTMKNYEARVQSWYQENDDKLKQVQNRQSLPKPKPPRLALRCSRHNVLVWSM